MKRWKCPNCRAGIESPAVRVAVCDVVRELPEPTMRQVVCHALLIASSPSFPSIMMLNISESSPGPLSYVATSWNFLSLVCSVSGSLVFIFVMFLRYVFLLVFVPVIKRHRQRVLLLRTIFLLVRYPILVGGFIDLLSLKDQFVQFVGNLSWSVERFHMRYWFHMRYCFD